MDKARTPKKLYFSKEIPSLLYAYGDVANPLQETCETLEVLLMDFLYDICGKVVELSSKQNRRIRLDDFKKALANDPKKLARVEELLYMYEDIRKAKMVFDPEVIE